MRGGKVPRVRSRRGSVKSGKGANTIGMKESQYSKLIESQITSSSSSHNPHKSGYSLLSRHPHLYSDAQGKITAIVTNSLPKTPEQIQNDNFAKEMEGIIKHTKNLMNSNSSRNNLYAEIGPMRSSKGNEHTASDKKESIDHKYEGPDAYHKYEDPDAYHKYEVPDAVKVGDIYVKMEKPYENMSSASTPIVTK